MRLTPKQQDKLLAVADHWGPSFHCFDSFLREKHLVRPATPEEVKAHYEAQSAELAETHVKLEETVQRRDYREAERLAQHAVYLVSEIFDRDDWVESMLATLSDAGLAEASKIRAKKGTMKGGESTIGKRNSA